MTRMPFFLKKSLSISGSRQAALGVARGRIAFARFAFVLLFLLVGARVFDLAVIQGKTQGEADDGRVAALSTPDRFRADIVDRNGVLLATSLETASLYADPSLIDEPQAVAAELSRLFPDLSYGDTLQKLQRPGRFVWVRRSLTPDEQYKVLELGRPGLGFRAGRSRIYPQGALAAHIVGYTDLDSRGLAGVERSFDNLLGRGGTPLALTLDIRLQYILHRELANAVKTFSAKSGAGAIMDIATGELLAAVSLPDFDPHDPGAAKPEQMFNNLTLGVFEQGSTFKIFSTAAYLEHFDPSLSKTFDASKPLVRGRFTISDYHPERRPLTIPEVFMHSSNIGAALMGEEIGAQGLKDFYADLGLMDRMPLEIDEVGRPILPSYWAETTTMTASYGHGIAVTPLQTVAAAASIVNGGILVKPTLILGAKKAESSQNGPEIRVVSPKTAHRMRQMMRLVVTEGTGKNADVPGYDVGGKTGTAEKLRVGGRGYDSKRRISSFMGFFPMEAPRYAVFVMVDEPHGTKESMGYATAGWVAAPAAGRVVAGMASVLGLPPQDPEAGAALSEALKSYVTYKSGDM